MAKEKKEKKVKEAPEAAEGGGKGLNMDVSLDFLKDIGKKKAGSGLPNKQTMNLVVLEKGENSKTTDIVLIVLLVVILAVFAKFGVLDQYNKKKAAEEEYAAAQQELEQNKQLLTRYEALFEKFSHYFKAFLTDDELKLVDRIDLIDMLDEHLFNVAEMQSININGNTIGISFYDVTLEQVGQLAQDLSDNELVTNVDLQTASTNKDKNGNVLTGTQKVLTATITLQVQIPPEEEPAEEVSDEEVSAQ
ncbi:MAG: hypothetical protein MJ083_03275 [Clostridia bacterium]|nr:hypothetical protein [Clostridia bacterium]